MMLDQRIIYPHSYPEFEAMGGKDEELMKILEFAHLAYIPAREGGFDTIKEWKDILSGGEKQRVSLHDPDHQVWLGWLRSSVCA